jgi:gamma-glutamyl:cysteine ligase YbdK (ATP-grasp superfamily)
MIKEPPFTVGIEEEYLLVDLASRDLDNDPPHSLIEECHAVGGGQVTPEFLRSQIEIGTKVSQTIPEAKQDLKRLRKIVVDVAKSTASRRSPRPRTRSRGRSSRSRPTRTATSPSRRRCRRPRAGC